MVRELGSASSRGVAIVLALVAVRWSMGCAASPTDVQNDFGSGSGKASGGSHSGSHAGSASGGSPTPSSGGEFSGSTGDPSSGGANAGSPNSGQPGQGGSPMGSGGSPFASGSAGSGIGSGTGSPMSSGMIMGSGMPTIPKPSGQCPTLANGANVTISAGGGSIGAQIWMGGTGSGPIILWWHGTASSPAAEVPISLDMTAVNAANAIVFGFNAGSRVGATNGNTGDAVWYSSDGVFADQAVACAIQNNHADPMHIHSAGYSAGALQTVWMWYARANYIASVISYSGGTDFLNQTAMPPGSNIAPAIAAHGAQGSDALVLDFASGSASWEMAIKMLGGFSIDCNDGGNHLDFFGKRAPGLQHVAFKFFQDHPFGVKPEPYTSLPPGYPTYCHID